MNEATASKTATSPAPARRNVRTLAIYSVFLLSGLSALLYQVTWQRALMLIYGSNTESVAMVVSAFLVGLGIGNLAGGALSARPGVSVIALFALAEFLIAAYGLASFTILERVGTLTLRSNAFMTGIAVFLVLLIPTVCMGATLPLLVADETRRSRSVGLAVSRLYFVNTLGAGMGAFVSGFVLLAEFHLHGTVWIAAALNAVSVAVIVATKLTRLR